VKHVLKAAVAACLASVVLSASASADRLDDVKARGKLIVGVSDTTPPFSFKKPGDSTVIGYDLDIVHAVAKRLGLTVETVSLSSAGVLDQDRAAVSWEALGSRMPSSKAASRTSTSQASIA